MQGSSCKFGYKKVGIYFYFYIYFFLLFTTIYFLFLFTFNKKINLCPSIIRIQSHLYGKTSLLLYKIISCFITTHVCTREFASPLFLTVRTPRKYKSRLQYFNIKKQETYGFYLFLIYTYKSILLQSYL